MCFKLTVIKFNDTLHKHMNLKNRISIKMQLFINIHAMDFLSGVLNKFKNYQIPLKV